MRPTRDAPLSSPPEACRVAIELFRIDDRLIHGQVVVGWGQPLDLNFIVLGFTIYYRFYIAQTALDAGWGTAAGVALLDLVLQVYFLIGLSTFAGLWLPASS